MYLLKLKEIFPHIWRDNWEHLTSLLESLSAEEDYLSAEEYTEDCQLLSWEPPSQLGVVDKKDAFYFLAGLIDAEAEAAFLDPQLRELKLQKRIVSEMREYFQ